MGAKVISIQRQDRQIIRIGDDIEVKVLRIVGSTKVTLRIEAPHEVLISLEGVDGHLIVDPET